MPVLLSLTVSILDGLMRRDIMKSWIKTYRGDMVRIDQIASVEHRGRWTNGNTLHQVIITLIGGYEIRCMSSSAKVDQEDEFKRIEAEIAMGGSS